MSQGNYTRLSLEERIIIENRYKNGEDYKSIAISINRSASTVWRELRRNGTPPDADTTRVNKPRADGRHYRGSIKSEKIKARKIAYLSRRSKFLVHSKIRYNASRADAKAKHRYRSRVIPKLDRPEYLELRQLVIARLQLRWSPEQIHGRLQYEGQDLVVSTRAIYAFIKKNPRLYLEKHLRCRGKPYRYHKAKYFNTTLGRCPISNRPSVVDKLMRLGDLEGDTIVGKDTRDRLLTHVDRKSGLVSIGLVKGFNAYKITKQTTKDINRVFTFGCHTITYDNGVEFMGWASTAKELGARIYFAHPYHSWERGRNENTNGLIRDFLPKGSDFHNLCISDIMKIESLLNNRPRKRLGYMTPSEYYANVALEVGI